MTRVLKKQIHTVSQVALMVKSVLMGSAVKIHVGADEKHKVNK